MTIVGPLCSTRSSARTSAQRARRLQKAVLSGSLVAAVLLLVVLPTVGAAVPTVSLSAPYTGTVAIHQARSNSGCAHASNVPAPSFNLSSGAGALGERATAWTVCSHATNSGTASSSFTVTIPLSPRVSGAHEFIVNWSVVASGSGVARLGSCLSHSSFSSYCSVFANRSAWEQTYLRDRTTGATYYPTNGWSYYASRLNYSYCSSGSCSTIVTTSGAGSLSSFSIFLNATLNASHRYSLVSELGATAEASVDVYQSSSNNALATAVIQFPLGPSPSKLVSIVVP
jgi:hypothetical protein